MGRSPGVPPLDPHLVMARTQCSGFEHIIIMLYSLYELNRHRYIITITVYLMANIK